MYICTNICTTVLVSFISFPNKFLDSIWRKTLRFNVRINSSQIITKITFVHFLYWLVAHSKLLFLCFLWKIVVTIGRSWMTRKNCSSLFRRRGFILHPCRSLVVPSLNCFKRRENCSSVLAFSEGSYSSASHVIEPGWDYRGKEQV